MNKNKIICIFLFISLFIIANFECKSQSNYNNIKGLTEELYYKLCGVWDYSKTIKLKDKFKFSWGEARWFPNGPIVFDLGPDALFYSGGGGILEIHSIEKVKENEYLIHTYLEREKKNYIFNIIINNDGTIYFKPDKFLGKFLWTWGKENPYYLHDGPKLEKK